MWINRRQFTAGAVATAALPMMKTARALTVRGVELGVQTFTFHEITMGGMGGVDMIIAGCKQLGVDSCELWAPQVEPFPMPSYGSVRWKETPSYKAAVASGKMPDVKPLTPEESKASRMKLRQWRENPPEGYFEGVRKRFDAGGVKLFAYNYSFSKDMSDGELEHGFNAAKALGVNLITASSTLSAVQRVPPFADKHKMRVAWHGHSSVNDPDALAGPESLLKAQAMSPWFRINLDCAHYASAGFDPVAFIREHHDVITNVHLHDTKRGVPEVSTPNGEGDTPIREVLALLQSNPGWKIPVFYEYEWVGKGSSVDAARQDFDYFRKALQAKA
jgi:sugar phosphate isomerase/epimerase